MAESQLYQIHGDNIVECVRAFEYVVGGLGKLVRSIRGPHESVSCPAYTIEIDGASLTFQFLPGYGEHRWNQDILGHVKRAGGRLREATDAVITRVNGASETVIAAIEFCGALPAGNQAWQRQGRAFSFAHAKVPYFFVTELGGFELGAERERKAERMPNPAIPFAFYAMTRYQDTVCLPVYEANSGAKPTTIGDYKSVYGKAEFLEFLRLTILGQSSANTATALADKCFALVELLADGKKRQDGLSSAQWREAKAALADGIGLLDYLSNRARLQWSKIAYIDSLTDSARVFMALGARLSFGLTSSSLPLSFVPKDQRVAFAQAAKKIYPDISEKFQQWLGSPHKHLAIAWVMGFKPRGDDARPDRGLPPLARMLAGDKADVLTFVYGPAPVSAWNTLATDPVKLAQNNGLWESILAVSDGVIADSSRKPDKTPRGYLKESWASILKEDKQPLSVKPEVLLLGEQDVDTAIHVAFESLGSDIAFEGMCNPPGGDWSGISFRWSPDTPEHRWLTLPRVSAEGAKRPDHVFALFGHGDTPVCLCIESKEKIGLLDTNIGPRLKRYAEALFEGMPSIHRAEKSNAWTIYEQEWAAKPISFVSAGAFPTTSILAPFAGLAADTKLDIHIAVRFINEGKSCELYLRGDTPAGKATAKQLQSHQTWSAFAKVILVD